MLHLFDTATGKVVPLEPREPGKVSMYVCGPTVYGPPHLGHGRFSLVFDVLRRYLEWTGLEVTYVSNITDIDDNIIDRANARGPSTRTEIAAECEAVWYEAMDAHRRQAPDRRPPRHRLRRPDGRADRRARRPRRRPTRPATASTSSAEPVDGLRPARPPVARLAAGRRPGRGQRGEALARSTSRCGRRPSRASRRGRRRGATAARAGTPSAS